MIIDCNNLTGGVALTNIRDPSSRVMLGPSRTVTTPKYFWKAICDPGLGRSVVFVGENPVGLEKNAVEVQKGCEYPGKNAEEQKVQEGFLYCYSLNDAIGKSEFQSFKDSFPPFHRTNCGTSVLGGFIDLPTIMT